MTRSPSLSSTSLHLWDGYFSEIARDQMETHFVVFDQGIDIPPRHDLRGGKASADSFAISSKDFVASMNCCFFAAENMSLQDAMIM